MKKVLSFLIGIVVLLHPITVEANGLSYLQPPETDGIPENISEYAEIIGNEFNICPELLEAIAWHESRYTATVTNGSCKGLMQLSSCHKYRFVDAGWSSNEWDDPYKNMYVGAQYLSELFETYEDVGIVLGLYHGEQNAIARGKSGKLSSYVTEILERSEELERIHGK